MSTLPLFPEDPRIVLQVTLDWTKLQITFDWRQTGVDKKLAHGAVWVAGNLLQWRFTSEGEVDELVSPVEFSAVEDVIRRVARRFPVARRDVTVSLRRLNPILNRLERVPVEKVGQTWQFLAVQILEMGEQLADSGPTPFVRETIPGPELAPTAQQEARHEEKQRLRREAIQRRDAPISKRNREPKAVPPPSTLLSSSPARARPVLPIPEIRLKISPAELPARDLFGASSRLDGFLQIERGSLVWVSNQSDDLLSLPHCAIDRLEYQIRTALRVTGPLRGRALLSDEVGLGKTIEAGLVLKEYVTRGLVHRFLVLTVPSLVDQWAEELEAKFGLQCNTTNKTEFRADPASFWTKQNWLIASIHTFKQENNLALASRQPWDMVIVDEAHYLRNRGSKAWQAVNVLPRQFMMLLTATPVQNSLEDLYNLVTLLKPGHLPSPREFRQRFIDRDCPYKPREAEQLRQLLGQVMIRNTRANAGIALPSRRAETILYEASPDERGFWEESDNELRAILLKMPAGKASLWGRLLLQAAGSSPAAWLDALQKFPDSDLAARWKTRAPLTRSWQRKVAVLPPLTQTSGGLVIFTQFLATQQALADALAMHKVKTWVLNGQVPAADRQRIVESFQNQGGALLLTRSGTEGRNLQFCHRLVNFDLPWNPMEIEQRIGRLHRIGQQQIVEIYNLVQAGTLQVHLLGVLQDKLNLFDLVVGETGLILGERFGSEDFEEEVFRRWQHSSGDVATAFQALGEELRRGRVELEEIKRLDEILFAHDYESI